MVQFFGRLVCTLACTLLGSLGVALADEMQATRRDAFDATAWVAANDALLDSLRGGFQTQPSIPGLAISFGFTRSVTLNGDLASQIHFTLPDLSHISVDQAKQVSDALAQARVVQSGAGNSVATNNSPAVSSPAQTLANMTVIQNSLSNQHIQTLTQIDTGVNSLGIMHSINTQGVLKDALMGAVGVR